jgi:DNA-directed RNA polymerase subunit M/transcription elongation factor TFIIS
MMAITTGQQSVVAEASRPKHVAPESSSSVTPENIPLDLSPSQSHDRYEPLPPGTWTLTFHGNCPRCHHHNNSLKVQIEVTPDDSQVSYVRCERCLDRWAAFGGRNTTRTSLLSTTTTEPDDVERGVRHSLAEIVKLAQERQPLEILPESLSAVVPHQLPEDTHRTAYLSAASPFLSLSTFRSDAKEPTPEDPDRHGTSPGYALMPKRQSTSRLFSKLKRKIVARFPTLNRSHGKETTDASTPKMSMRRFEKAPVQSPPCSDQNPAWSKVPLSLEDHEAAPSSSSEVETLEPSKRIAEVVAFVASLDKSAINLMTEQERSQWLRREYTKFKVHRRKSVSVAPLGMSTIVQTSIQNELPRPPLAELPLDMFGVGGHIEGFEILDSALRRGSFTISESSGAQSMSEGTTLFESQRSSGQRHLQRLRQGLSRPQSSPYSLYAHSRLPPNTRNSHATLDLSERESVLADCNTLATPRELSPENLRESRNGLVLQRPQSLCSTTPSGSCSRPQSLCSIRPQSLRSIRTQSLRSVRPQSLRVTRRRRLHPRIRQRMRRSLESLGISSIRAHITSRASQSSTLHGSSEERVDDWDRRDLVTPMPNPNPVVTDMRIISSSVPEVSAILTDGTTLIHGQEVNLPDRTNTSSLIPRPITTAAHEESRSDLDTGPNLEILDERSSLIPVPGPDNLITHRRSTSSLIPRQSEALGSQNDLHVRSHGNDTQPNQAGGTSSGFRGGDSTPQDSGEPSSSKRPRRERPDDNNDNSDPHRRKRKQKRDFDHGESPPKPFACPFPKHDPMNHTTCWEFTFQKDRFGDLR